MSEYDTANAHGAKLGKEAFKCTGIAGSYPVPLMDANWGRSDPQSKESYRHV
jgi:hypothetical protein